MQCPSVSRRPHHLPSSYLPSSFYYFLSTIMPNVLNENEVSTRDLASGTRKRISHDALQLGPRKKPYVSFLIATSSTSPLSYIQEVLKITIDRCSTDPLVHHGRHFGRSIHALCNVPSLINNGIIRMASDKPEEELSAQ